MNVRIPGRRLLIAPVLVLALLAGGAIARVQGQCGPFTDVSPAICPYVLELYYLGITAGTSPTTYSPDAALTRGQAAVFVSKGVNQAITRSSRRAALGQWWTTDPVVWLTGLGTVELPSPPSWPFDAMTCDGTDLWVGSYSNVSRVRVSDGKLLDSWTTERAVVSLLAAMGRVIVAEFQPPVGGGPGRISIIDPSQPSGAVTPVADLQGVPSRLAFDGSRVWVATDSGVAILTPAAAPPWTVQTVANGFQAPSGIVFDGQNVWVTDTGPCSLLRLDAAGAVQQTVATCSVDSPTFDGTNLLVPASSGVQVIRASDGTFVQTLSFPGDPPDRAVFDGERILLVHNSGPQISPATLTLIRATDFSLIRQDFFPPFGFGVSGGTADGTNFWVVYYGGSGSVLARY